MVSSRNLIIANISLALVALILILALFGVELPTIGKAKLILGKDDAVCMVAWQGEFTEWDDLARCCLEARKQLSCQPHRETIAGVNLHHVCMTGNSSLQYYLNNRALAYCQQQTIWR